MDGGTILHVAEGLGGGLATAITQYIGRMPDYRHVVAASLEPTWPVDPGLARLASIHELRGGVVSQYLSLLRLLDRLTVDIIHAHSSWAGVYVRALPAARRPSVVYSPHSFAFERRDVPNAIRTGYRLVERALVPRASVLAAVGSHEAALMRSLGAGNVVVVPHAVPDAAGSGQGAVRHPGFRVATAGRVTAQKDPAFLRSAARRTWDEDPTVRWRWIGGGDVVEEGRLRSSGVEVTGWLDQRATIEALRDVDVYVHTAAWEAAIPLTVIEAMAAGVPVVARAIPSVVDEGVPCVVPSSTAMAEAVLGLRARASRRRLLAAQQRVLEAHHPDRQRAALVAAYDLAAQRPVTRRVTGVRAG